MNQKYEKLKTLLMELFQLDQPDLDFGLYRIMHAKSAEITQFLDNELLPQVKDAFRLYQSANRVEIEEDIKKAVEQARGLGVDPETTQKVKDLRALLEGEAVDLDALEGEVYDHLYSFFRRYYSDGDFMAKRVYKAGVYAIPYEGEEVAFHWANKDHYYIKTSEYLRDYTFRLRPYNNENPMRVHFRLLDVAEGEHGDVNAPEGRDRAFILATQGKSGKDFAAEVDGLNGKELAIHFEYRPTTLTDWPEEERSGKRKPPVQKDLYGLAVRHILAESDAVSTEWKTELERRHVLANGETAHYSRLEAHLKRFTARNTFDYFIHKDLGSFLRRELDFYIKNEVMHLDDVENETAPRVEQYLSSIKVIRTIAHNIIDFLAQLENFQKKLWLKKKFVVDTQWCIALGHIPERFYPEIAHNKSQRREWISILAIDEIPSELTRHGYSDILTIEFLRSHPTLMVDTRNFDRDFTSRLLEAISDVDEHSDAVLVHSENFQALSLMQTKYLERVSCIYIDPPYNTDASAIDYKNGYKASSWLSLLSDRTLLSKRLMASDAVLIAAIDDEQQRELSFLLSGVFGNPLLGTICVRANPSGRPTQAGYSVSHEYLLFAGKSTGSVIGRMPPTDAQRARFSHADEVGPFEWRNLRREGSNSDRAARPALYYPIYIRGNAIRVPKLDWDDQERTWLVCEPPDVDEIVVWPTSEDGRAKTWRWEWQTVMSRMESLAVRPDRSGNAYVYLKRRPHEKGVVSVSSWFEAKYSATEHGTAVIKALFGQRSFSYPKSIHAVVDAIYVGGARQRGAIILDHFAGSGTTGHAVINLNREDGGRRKFILVEMGDHFDTVLLPRIKKVTFTPEWKDGKPKRPATLEEAKRSPVLIKVLRLESYEDTLNNLETHRTEKQQLLLASRDAKGTNALKEQYILRYMLDVETRGSQSLLNVKAFADPTAYKLRVKSPGSDESREVNVDLLETFNWMIGLIVSRIAAPQTFSAEFKRDSENRLRLSGRLKPEVDGKYWFRTVIGTTPDSRRTLVIWRKLFNEPEQDNLVLDEWFAKQGYTGSDNLFDLIYVNGDNNLENLKTAEEMWKVRLIEADFHRSMFEMDTT